MQGFTVNIESGAGVLSQFRDEDFAASGAKIVNKTDAFKQVSIQSVKLYLYLTL
jgi:NAD/NADP transhydrogenase alpha subunit